jgi:septal ring factor EnvC (AmiA/AmiB activator)
MSNNSVLLFQEFMVLKAENQLVQASRDVEHQKEMNEQTHFLLEELKKQVETEENELKKLESELHHSMSEVHKNLGAVDNLLKKLEQLTTKSAVRVSQSGVVSELGLLASSVFAVPHLSSFIKIRDTTLRLQEEAP